MRHYINMKPVHQILPAVITGNKGSKPHARNRTAPGTMNLFPPEDIIRSAWEHLAGKQLAARTRPLRIYSSPGRTRLLVEVPDRSWPRQLRAYEGLLLDRVNHLLGETLVTELEWRVNPELAAPLPRPSLPRKPPARETDPALEGAAESIADPELRELFLRTAQKMAR